jgi:hypothetical protein
VSEDNHVTRRELSLELKAARSEFRLLLFGAVAANQALFHMDVGGVVASSVAFAAIARWAYTIKKGAA